MRTVVAHTRNRHTDPGCYVHATANSVQYPYTPFTSWFIHRPCKLATMSTLTPEVRADLTLLRQQTAEVRRALAHTHRLGAERSATVLRLRDAKVPFRVIAQAMGASVAAVQSILDRAEQRTATPPATMGAGTTLKAGIAR